MSREQVLATLREHAPALQAKGILHLALFGSTARDEAGPESDVDLMAEYDPERKFSLLDISRFHLDLQDMLGAKVDLADRSRMRAIIKESAEEDAINAF